MARVMEGGEDVVDIAFPGWSQARAEEDRANGRGVVFSWVCSYGGC